MRTLSERLLEAAEEVFAREIKSAANPDDHFWVLDRPTSDLLREAAALCKRYKDAPVGPVVGYKVAAIQGGHVMVECNDPSSLKGQRVRLVVEGDA